MHEIQERGAHTHLTLTPTTFVILNEPVMHYSINHGVLQ